MSTRIRTLVELKVLFIHKYSVKKIFLLIQKAYEKLIDKNHSEHITMNMFNFTHEQLFFISYAQMWCRSEKLNDDDELNKRFYLQHPPDEIRYEKFIMILMHQAIFFYSLVIILNRSHRMKLRLNVFILLSVYIW